MGPYLASSDSTEGAPFMPVFHSCQRSTTVESVRDILYTGIEPPAPGGRDVVEVLEVDVVSCGGWGCWDCDWEGCGCGWDWDWDCEGCGCWDWEDCCCGGKVRAVMACSGDSLALLAFEVEEDWLWWW